MSPLSPSEGVLSENTTVASRYRVLFELGRGGTARVFLAVVEGPSGFNKLVVLKALKRELVSDDEFHGMFLNEARLSSRLSHGNIVQVLEALEHNDTPVIAMEYLAGKSLYEVRCRAPQLLSLDAEIYVLSQALAGLHYSHELSDFDGTPLEVVHRDLTPQNVFVTYDGQVKVLDFGIAKLAGSLVETQVGVVKGKVRYMAPEQLDGSLVDRRADLFAAGVMLWEAITGRRLWLEMTDVEVVNAVLDGEVPSPRVFRPDVDDELEQICLRALAPRPADRFPTALVFQEALENYLTHRRSRVTARDVGLRMTSEFATDREQLARAIEERLGYSSLLRNSPPPRAPSVNPPPPGSERRSLRASAPPKPSRPMATPTPSELPLADEPVAFSVVKQARGSSTRPLWLALAVAVALAGYLLTWQPSEPTVSGPTPAAQVSSLPRVIPPLDPPLATAPPLASSGVPQRSNAKGRPRVSPSHGGAR